MQSICSVFISTEDSTKHKKIRLSVCYGLAPAGWGFSSPCDPEQDYAAVNRNAMNLLWHFTKIIQATQNCTSDGFLVYCIHNWSLSLNYSWHLLILHLIICEDAYKKSNSSCIASNTFSTPGWNICKLCLRSRTTRAFHSMWASCLLFNNLPRMPPSGRTTAHCTPLLTRQPYILTITFTGSWMSTSLFWVCHHPTRVIAAKHVCYLQHTAIAAPYTENTHSKVCHWSIIFSIYSSERLEWVSKIIETL